MRIMLVCSAVVTRQVIKSCRGAYWRYGRYESEASRNICHVCYKCVDCFPVCCAVQGTAFETSATVPMTATRTTDSETVDPPAICTSTESAPGCHLAVSGKKTPILPFKPARGSSGVPSRSESAATTPETIVCGTCYEPLQELKEAPAMLIPPNGDQRVRPRRIPRRGVSPFLVRRGGQCH